MSYKCVILVLNAISDCLKPVPSLLMQFWFILSEASLISERNHGSGCGLDWKRRFLEQCRKRNDTENWHRWEKRKDCPKRPVSAKKCCCWSKWEVKMRKSIQSYKERKNALYQNWHNLGWSLWKKKMKCTMTMNKAIKILKKFNK